MIHVAEVIRGALRPLRERPLAFLAWYGLHLAASIVLALAARPLVAAELNGETPARIGRFFALTMPLHLLVLAILLMTFAAAQRLVLRPADTSLFYLRLRGFELRLALLFIILLVIVSVAAAVAGSLSMALVFGARLLAGSPVEGPTLYTQAAFDLLVLGTAAGLGVRLSLAAPLTLLRGKLVIGESWHLTRGSFWKLLGAYLLLALVVIALAAAAMALAAGPQGLEALRSLDPQRAVDARIIRGMGPIDAIVIGGWLATSLVASLTASFAGGATATTAAALATDVNRLADTFA